MFHTTDGGRNWHRSLRATLLEPRVVAGPEWLATIRCSRQHEWIVFSAPDGGASSQEPFVAYARRHGRWVPVFDDGYFSVLYPRVGKLPSGPPGNYVSLINQRPLGSPFAVTGSAAEFLGYSYAGKQGIGYLGMSQGGKFSARGLLSSFAPRAPVAASFVDSLRGWVVGAGKSGNGVIVRTEDGGRSWTRVFSPS